MQFFQCGSLRIDNIKGGFDTFYRESECPSIEKVRYISKTRGIDKGSEVITFYYRNGSERSIERPMKKNRDGEYVPLCDPYNWQYGIAVSYDGRYIYTSKWEGGVFCFNAADFSLKWKNTMGSVRDIFTVKVGDKIYCHNDKKGLVVLDAETGEQTALLTGSSSDFYRLDEERFLMGPKRNSMYIYRFDDMSEQKKIKCSEIVTDGRDDWIFRNAWLEKNTLCIDAFTGSAGMENVFRYEL